jgi:hypothetical protein
MLRALQDGQVGTVEIFGNLDELALEPKHAIHDSTGDRMPPKTFRSLKTVKAGAQYGLHALRAALFID